MLVASEPDDLADAFRRLLDNPISSTTPEHALEWLPEMFGTASATGADTAGKAEEGIGNPTQVSINTALPATESVAGDVAAGQTGERVGETLQTCGESRVRGGARQCPQLGVDLADTFGQLRCCGCLPTVDECVDQLDPSVDFVSNCDLGGESVPGPAQHVENSAPDRGGLTKCGVNDGARSAADHHRYCDDGSQSFIDHRRSYSWVMVSADA
nr:hypothetical protein GCM10017611_06290 [Rhodococcus wratislaviensis]